ncbi:phosphatase PAP2 family protein [Calditrichota bacterium LG25]
MEALTYYEGKLRVADKATIIYQLFILAVIFFNYPRIPNGFWLILIHLAIIAFLLWLPNLGGGRILNWIRLWNLVPIILFNFSELHFIVHNVRPQDMDTLLIQIDKNLFGVHPTIWLEKFHHPILTEYLQLVYTSFYFLPLILAVLLYRKNRMEEFDYFAFIIVYGFYLSYLGYFMVPAIGPRFTLDHLQSFPLHGLWLSDHLQHLLNRLENIQRDVFPSGHTKITVLTMYFAARYHRKYFYALLIIGPSLIFSTVYLRYHYVIDVIAGFAFAGFVIVTAPAFYRLLSWLQFVPLRSSEECG